MCGRNPSQFPAHRRASLMHDSIVSFARRSRCGSCRVRTVEASCAHEDSRAPISRWHMIPWHTRRVPATSANACGDLSAPRSCAFPRGNLTMHIHAHACRSRSFAISLLRRCALCNAPSLSTWTPRGVSSTSLGHIRGSCESPSFSLFLRDVDGRLTSRASVCDVVSLHVHRRDGSCVGVVGHEDDRRANRRRIGFSTTEWRSRVHT